VPAPPSAATASSAGAASSAPIDTVPGMARVTDRANLYGDAAAGKLSEAVRDALPRVYVPNLQSNDVYVIDPATFTVVDKFRVGLNPQHVVPSWDLKTLWVANNAENTTKGSLTPIDPKTGKPGKPIAVEDPYNMYFTPDGKEAIVVAEAFKRLDFRDAQTMALKSSLATPECKGINHADFSIDGRFAIFTCEFSGTLVKIDMVGRKVLGYLKLSTGKMPQDIRVSPDGSTFLRRRHDGRRRLRHRRRELQGDRLHQDRQGNARPVPEPRRHQALRHQPRLEQDPRRRQGNGQRLGARLRDPQGRRHAGRSPAAAAPTWATSAPTASGCGCRAATTTSSTRSTRRPAR
jgi:YVTN family beta-propeller protein